MVHSSGLSVFGRRRAWAGAWLLALIALLIALSFLPLRRASAQQMAVTVASTRLARDQQLLQQIERLRLPNAQVGRLWAQIASDEQDLGRLDQAEQAYNRALQVLEHDPALADDYAIVLNNLGTLYAVRGDAKASLDCRKRALAIQQKRGDPLAIARADGHLADAYLRLGRNKEAREHAHAAFSAMDELPAATSSDKGSALVAYSYASCMTGHCTEGLAAAHRAHALAAAMHSGESFALGQVFVAEGFAEWRTGDLAAAERDLREGVRILRANLAAGHPFIIQALEIYRECLSDAHKNAEATQVADEVQSAMATSRSCVGCTVSVHSLRER